MVGIAQLHPAVDEPVSEYWPVYTIGHSTRTIPEFVGLLQIAAVDLVVDIRSVPRSRTIPQYNLDLLPDCACLVADRPHANPRAGRLAS